MKKKRLKKTARHRSSKAPDTRIAQDIGAWRNWWRISAVLILVAIGVGLYADTLEPPFVFDDLRNIRHNSHLRLERLSLKGLLNVGLNSPTGNRPVANISFALNHYLHGYDVRGFRLVNIFIHIGTAILLFFFLNITLHLAGGCSPHQRDSRDHEFSLKPSLTGKMPDDANLTAIAFFAALVWLVHPLQTQSVTYIVQRMNSMAAFFYIGTLLLYAHSRIANNVIRRRLLLGGSIVAGLLAFGCKEISATLPVFILLYEWYFFQDMSRDWLKRRAIVGGVVISLAGAAALVYLDFDPIQRISAGYAQRDFDLPQRLLTEPRVVAYYLSLLILPHPARLNLVHDFPLSRSLLVPPTTLMALLALLMLIVLAAVIAGRQRLVSFCILWFSGQLIIESSLIGLEIIFEHRLYLPAMFIILVFVLKSRQYIRPRGIWAAGLCLIVLAFSVWTHERNKVWFSEVALWTDCVKKAPAATRARNNLGLALASAGRINDAIQQHRQAVALDPDNAKAHNNLGRALDQGGNLDEAAYHYRQAITINPAYAMAHNNLGNILARQGQLEEAVNHYNQAIHIKSDYAEAYNNMGLALARHARFDAAVESYQKALELQPASADIRNNLGLALVWSGNTEAAQGHFIKALRLDPNHARAHNNLGLTWAYLGNLNQAIDHYTHALRLKPNMADTRNNLGAALVSQGRLDEAIVQFETALKLKPDLETARQNLIRVRAQSSLKP